MRGLVPRPIHKGGFFMINRRIMIFGLIGLMVLSLVTLGKKLVTKDITEIPKEMEIVSLILVIPWCIKGPEAIAILILREF